VLSKYQITFSNYFGLVSYKKENTVGIPILALVENSTWAPMQASSRLQLLVFLWFFF